VLPLWGIPEHARQVAAQVLARGDGARQDLAGQVFDGRLGWRATIPEACHTTVLSRAADLTAVATWVRYDLWRFLR